MCTTRHLDEYKFCTKCASFTPQVRLARPFPPVPTLMMSAHGAHGALFTQFLWVHRDRTLHPPPLPAMNCRKCNADNFSVLHRPCLHAFLFSAFFLRSKNCCQQMQNARRKEETFLFLPASVVSADKKKKGVAFWEGGFGGRYAEREC